MLGMPIAVDGAPKDPNHEWQGLKEMPMYVTHVQPDDNVQAKCPYDCDYVIDY